MTTSPKPHSYTFICVEFTGKENKRSSHVKGKQLDSSNGLENDNPFSFTNFVKKDAALKSGGRVLQVGIILDVDLENTDRIILV